MLTSLRSGKSNGFVWVILILLIIGLAGFGIGGSGAGGASTAVASVGDADVTVDEYVRAYNQENQRIAQQFRRALTPEEIRLFGVDQQVLSQLLNGAALDGEAARLGISVGDETVRTRLMRTQAFRGIDGNFDETAYEFALQQSGLNPAEYDNIVRGETTRQVLQAAIMAGVNAPDTAAEAIVSFLGQNRRVNWVRLNATHLDTPVGAPSDAQLQEFYEANPADYTLPETRDITYAYVTEAMLAETMEISDAEVREIYDERINEFRAPARRLLDRIVFGTADEARAAKARIDEGTAGFEDIATERGLETDDMDLGEVVEGDLNADERALIFAAEDLGVYGPVTSDLGPALYRINAILDETLVTFDAARDELSTEVALERAADQIAAEFDVVEDLLAGGATLEEVAAETLLELGSMSLTADTTDGVAADQAFRDEALSADEGEERDPINLTDGLAVIRVNEIKAPALQPLETIKLRLAEAWRLAETEAQITNLGTVLKDRIDGGESLGDVAATYNLVMVEDGPLGRNGIIEDTPPEFVAAIFNADLNDIVVVPDSGSVLIGQIIEIIPEDMTSEDVAQPLSLFSRELDAATANDIFAYFTQGLQDEAGISVNQSLITNIQNQLSGVGGYGN